MGGEQISWSNSSSFNPNMSNSDIYSRVKTKIVLKKVHIRVKGRAVLHLTEQFFQSLTHLRNRKWGSQFLPFSPLPPSGVLATPSPTLTGLVAPTFLVMWTPRLETYPT